MVFGSVCDFMRIHIHAFYVTPDSFNLLCKHVLAENMSKKEQEMRLRVGSTRPANSSTFTDGLDVLFTGFSIAFTHVDDYGVSRRLDDGNWTGVLGAIQHGVKHWLPTA